MVTAPKTLAWRLTVLATLGLAALMASALYLASGPFAQAQVVGEQAFISISEPDEIVIGEWAEYTVTAEGIGTSPNTGHEMSITSSGNQIRADSGCSSDVRIKFSPTASNNSMTLTIYACELGTGSLTAVLGVGTPKGDFTVDTVTKDIEVVPRKVRFGSGSYSVNEGHDTSITVHLNPASGSTVDIPIKVDGLGPTQSSDFTVSGLTGGNLTFNSGDTSRSFTIQANQDTDCDNQTVEITFGSLPSGVAAESPSTATLTIDDDEDPTECNGPTPTGTPTSTPTPTATPTATPLPVVTIVRDRQTGSAVTEGDSVRFAVRISRPQASNVPVNISVVDSGSFLAGVAPKRTTIISNSTQKTLKLQTVDDMVNEPNGTIRVTIQSGVGYTVGNPSGASVTVKDNDVLLAPTSLRANGNIVSGQISVWWDAVDGATGYELRYAVECVGATLYMLPHECRLGNWMTTNRVASTSTKLTVGSDSNDQLSTDETLYRLEVRAFNRLGPSKEWSESAFVLPTDEPPALSEDAIAKFPFIAMGTIYGFLPKNSSGVHEFTYTFCNATKPPDVNINSPRLMANMAHWGTGSRKGSSTSNNLVAVTSSDTVPDGACGPPTLDGVGIPTSGHNAIMFVNDTEMYRVDCSQDGTRSPSCWRSRSDELSLIQQYFGRQLALQPIEKGWILLSKDVGGEGNAGYWNFLGHRDACTLAEHTIVHEMGHAFGIGGHLIHEHPFNSELSIMSSGYEHYIYYCEPQAYDIVAIMANYQSR